MTQSPGGRDAFTYGVVQQALEVRELLAELWTDCV